MTPWNSVWKPLDPAGRQIDLNFLLTFPTADVFLLFIDVLKELFYLIYYPKFKNFVLYFGLLKLGNKFMAIIN